MSPKSASAPLLIEQPDAPAVSTLPVVAQAEGVALFERLACDPNASVEKIERLMALWERNEAKVAESAFNAAMSAAQAEMRPIAADASNPQTHSKYASYSALDNGLRLIYTRHGFGLSFDTGELPGADVVRVLCYVTHKAGYARTYHADMPADGKGAKGGDVMTKTHAVGSAMSYGMRYLLKMIFNVAVGEDDDDGNAAGGSQVRADVVAPEGFDAWFAALEGVASNGWPVLSDAWNRSKEAFRKHLVTTNRRAWDELRKRAQAVKG